MNTTLTNSVISPIAADEAVVAIFPTHDAAEQAVRHLADAGLLMREISIVGRNFETREDVQGFYQPADAALAGAAQGAWFGGVFGMLMGAMGFFILPAIGALMVLGPLSGFIAGAVGGAGVGALISGLMAAGIPRDQALKYQDRLQAGEFLVVVHGTAGEAARAHGILAETQQTHLQTYSASNHAK
ncbi:hypothetical protein CCAX7_41640 [Capsulimonas corticalis]|uniref:Uncharacterized protein n=1 Tax=Capsulimonas corticalis TaxID=2219043 RepID=A0A402CXZ3_9BACT|nr:general stress protein [Capsulimonas corticalis]BDI32113.1 hypothetical protein CCAX7_41640 [Capsulimonas corticalis]